MNYGEKTLTVQIKIPEEVNKILRIEAIREGISLKQYCVKVLSEYAKKVI
jgi:predicted HicB family RNase H-like nuclease